MQFSKLKETTMDNYRKLRQDELENLKAVLKKRNIKRKGNSLTALRCAIYARKSQKDEKDLSLPSQIEYCKSLIDNCELLEFKATYQEDNKSGMSDNRPQFQAMIKSLKDKEIDVVVVYKWDRFARRSSDAQNYYNEVVKSGGAVIAGDSVVVVDSAQSLYFQQIMWANSEYQARTVAENTIDKMITEAKRGRYIAGVAPYGYSKDETTKALVLDVEESIVVNSIFSQLSHGISISSITTNLNNDGHKTRQHKRFSKQSVMFIARNPVYTGTLTYNKTGGKKKDKRLLQKDYEEVVIHNAHPAIVSKEVFDLIQEHLDTKQRVRVKDTGYVYLLSGLITCKSCGSKMTGESQHSRT